MKTYLIKSNLGLNDCLDLGRKYKQYDNQSFINMKQYLYEFQDLVAYNAAKAGLEKPSASYLINERAMKYDPYVGGGSSSSR